MAAPKFFVVARVVGRERALPLWKERLVHLCNVSATEQNLNGHEQGLASRDYDLYHYDCAGGWLKRTGDLDHDSRTSHVVVYHFWAVDEARREDLIKSFLNVSSDFHRVLQSFGILKEVRDEKMVTLWVRPKDVQEFDRFNSSPKFQDLLADAKEKSEKTEVHLSQAFNGHLNLKSSAQ